MSFFVEIYRNGSSVPNRKSMPNFWRVHTRNKRNVFEYVFVKGSLTRFAYKRDLKSLADTMVQLNDGAGLLASTRIL